MTTLLRFLVVVCGVTVLGPIASGGDVAGPFSFGELIEEVLGEHNGISATVRLTVGSHYLDGAEFPTVQYRFSKGLLWHDEYVWPANAVHKNGTSARQDAYATNVCDGTISGVLDRTPDAVSPTERACQVDRPRNVYWIERGSTRRRTAVRREEVAGHPCVRSKIEAFNHRANRVAVFTWEATDLNLFPVRIYCQDGTFSVDLSFTEIQVAGEEHTPEEKSEITR